MPNRIIKERVCISEDFNALSWFEQSFFMRLIVTVDDFGRYYARPAVLRGRMFPLKRVSDKQIVNTLNKLAQMRMLRLYSIEDLPYLEILAWDKHQSIRAQRSKFPEPKAFESNCMQMFADVSVIQSNPNPNRESNRESGRKSSRFSAPSIEEIMEYCKQRSNAVDAERFFNFYAAKGWMVGKNSMKDWKAAVRSWERRDADGAGNAVAPAQNAAGNTSGFSVETDTL